MRKTYYTLTVFSCLALVQIAAPLSTIARRELVLRHGEQFRFRTEPIDPYDAFRGRYVALQFEQAEVALPDGVRFEWDQKVFARIEKDSQGFGRIAEVTAERPREGAYVVAQVRWRRRNDVIRLDLPFDRYYMDETVAPAAERAYREQRRRGARDSYVTVRIKDGIAVLEELYLDGKPISEFLEESE
jgi:uncharacterized membrane-anchored protein